MNHPDDFQFEKPKRKRSPLHLRRVRMLLMVLILGVVALLPLIHRLMEVHPAIWQTAPVINIDINGTWTGSSYQPGGVYPEFPFQMTIQRNGDFVSGTTYIEDPTDAGMYARMTFSGSIEYGMITFYETDILSQQHPSNQFWCMKTAHLVQDGDMLIGVFTAPQCTPGNIELRRVVGTG